MSSLLSSLRLETWWAVQAGKGGEEGEEGSRRFMAARDAFRGLPSFLRRRWPYSYDLCDAEAGSHRHIYWFYLVPGSIHYLWFQFLFTLSDEAIYSFHHIGKEYNSPLFNCHPDICYVCYRTFLSPWHQYSYYFALSSTSKYEEDDVEDDEDDRHACHRHFLEYV